MVSLVYFFSIYICFFLIWEKNLRKQKTCPFDTRGKIKEVAIKPQEGTCLKESFAIVVLCFDLILLEITSESFV